MSLIDIFTSLYLRLGVGSVSTKQQKVKPSERGDDSLGKEKGNAGEDCFGDERMFFLKIFNGNK